MTTRRAKNFENYSQERYMSAVEFTELRGINGVPVSARAAILSNKSKREFVWFIQFLSLQEGGLRKVARELLDMFPERIGTPLMRTAEISPEKTWPEKLVLDVFRELGLRNYYDSLYESEVEAKTGHELIFICRKFATAERGRGRLVRTQTWSIEDLLTELCINPKICFALPGESKESSTGDWRRYLEENPDVECQASESADLIYFQDVIGALVEYKAHRENQIRDRFQQTAISRKIWATLDYAAASRGMVVLDGLEGRGKTEAVKAWCEINASRARFVSLKGITSKTAAFREIARSLGIASSYTRTAPEMQARIEDVLKRSKLLLVLDEAHFLFNQSRRMYSRPELIDWIDTAICNQGVGIALITTPQFIVCMTRAADQVEWNYRQFRRRVRRWVMLPKQNSEADITAVARSIFSGANESVIKHVVGYALLSKRDLSAIGDVATELRVMTGSDDLGKVTIAQAQQAIYEFLLPSDKAFLVGMEASRKGQGRKKAAQIQCPDLPTDPIPESEGPLEPASGSRLLKAAVPKSLHNLPRRSNITESA